MRINFPALFLMVACAFGLPATGCGRSRLPTVPVQGKVTWQSKPLTDGTVMFTPLQVSGDMPKRPAIGQLGQDGCYRLSSFRENDGLLPGEYRVTVTSYKSQPTPENPEAPCVWRIPKRYGNSSESGLKFTVPEDARGRLTFNIDIKAD